MGSDVASSLASRIQSGKSLAELAGLGPYFFYSYPQFLGGLTVIDSNDRSRYKALQLQVTRRLTSDNVDTGADDSTRVHQMWDIIGTVVTALGDAGNVANKKKFMLHLAWHEGDRITARIQGGNGPARSFYQIERERAIDAVSYARDNDWVGVLADAAGLGSDHTQPILNALDELNQDPSNPTFPSGNLIEEKLRAVDLFGTYGQNARSPLGVNTNSMPNSSFTDYLGNLVDSHAPVWTVGIAVTCELDSSTPGNRPDVDGYWQQLEQMSASMFDMFWGKSMDELRQLSPEQMFAFADRFRDLMFNMPFQLPQNLLMLGRTVAILSGMCTGLDKDFNLWNQLSPYATKLVSQEVGSNWRVWLDEAIFRAGPQGVDEAVSALKKIQRNADELNRAANELREKYGK